ncbi:MAG: CHASE2 domain-containing protein [Candidatus Tectimicrobiota bacterium]
MERVPDEASAALQDGWSSSRVVRLWAGSQGRPVALLLTLLLLVAAGLGEVLWEPGRQLVFDAYQRLFPRREQAYPALLVDIDEASIAAVGQWPWPRTRLARLIEAVQQYDVRAIGLDLLMPEADRLSPALVLADRTDISPELRDTLLHLPSNDALLAETLARGPVVLGRAALAETQPSPILPHDQTTLLNTAPELPLRDYAGHVANLPELEDAAAGRGYLNAVVDTDGVVRRMPLALRIQGYIAPSLALELWRVAQNQPAYRVLGDRQGVHGVQIGEHFVPTDPDGRLRLHFAVSDPARRVSALDVLRGTAHAARLRQRIALIGVTALGLTDVAVTPVEARMDGAEVQIQVLENLASGSRLIRPWCMPWIEAGAFAVLALVFIWLVPRFQPLWGVLLWLGSLGLLGVGGLSLYLQGRLLFDPAWPALGGSAVFIALVTAGLAASDRRRRELRAALEVERLERSRIAGELQVARDIQMGMLPAPDAIAGLPETVELYALLEPAREVGGDLYNAFMLDEHHFFFLVGDVAGKGVPASLFMALSTSLCQSTALHETGPLDRVMTAVNAEVARYNKAALFVTAVAGLLDTRTGDLELCSAGHDAPLVLRLGAEPSALSAAGGLPLCVLDDYLYESNHVQLQPGDVVLMMTDGVTEAQNRQTQLYGLERVFSCCAALQATQNPLTPAGLCQGLYADVQRFAEGMEPADDVTILALRYVAPGRQEPAAVFNGQ